jgi:hypothetical protein
MGSTYDQQQTENSHELVRQAKEQAKGVRVAGVDLAIYADDDVIVGHNFHFTL